jgi:23S rRNA (guanosine2251-2'-O)-methyltransferase
VRELLRAGVRPVRQLFVAEGGHSASLADIVDLAAEAGTPLRWVSRDRIQSMAVTDAPQGVVAVAGPVREWALDELLAAPEPFIVVLDGVTDPHNLGAVMRNAVSAGATGLVVGRHRAASLSPAAVKAAAGAVEYLPVAPVGGVPAALQACRDAGVWTVGLDATGPTSLWALPVATDPVALVLGSEGRGLSQLVRKRCEILASIPLSGPLDSLNVSAAAALACFEIARRRRQPVN